MKSSTSYYPASTLNADERNVIANNLKMWAAQHFTKDNPDFETWLDWWYLDASTETWEDELEFGGLVWERTLTSKQQLRQCKFLGENTGDGFKEAVMDFAVIEQNPNAATNKGGRKSQGQQLLEQGHDVAQVIVDGIYSGMIVDARMRWYPGKSPFDADDR